MTNLVEFIRACVAEDEQVARAAQGRLAWASKEDRTLVIETSGDDSMGWEFGGGDGVWRCDDPDDDCHLYRISAFREAEHITRHDPARVLAECVAKRKIIDLHENASERYEALALYQVMQLHAAVYADHPDYREEWRP